MTEDKRPKIIQQLAEARELFDLTGKHDNESTSVQQLLGFFAKHKYLTESQAYFANKLINKSKNMRTQ
jgi:hypothetical protein